MLPSHAHLAIEGIGVFTVAASLLFVKFFATVLVQAIVRLRHRAFVRPEDAAFFGRGAEPRAEEHPLVGLAANVLRNDGENIPYFLFLLLAHVLLGASPTSAPVLATVFVASRYVHTLAYLRPTQPLRNVAYQTGLWTTFIVAAQAIWALSAGV